MRAKPSEVKALVPVLEADHESVEDAAKAVLETLSDLRRDDRQLLLIRYQDGRPVIGMPFSTVGQVQKALQKGLGGPGWALAYLRTPESVEASREAIEAVVEASHCNTCQHPRAAHIEKKWNEALKGPAKWREPGCSIPNCTCKERK